MAKQKMTETDAEALRRNNQRLATAYKNAPPNQQDQREAIKEELVRIERERQQIGRSNAQAQGLCEKHGPFKGPTCMHCTSVYLGHMAEDQDNE